MIAYLIGVDGGGTGTRVRIADRSGTLLAQGSAGPSALGQGVEAAWEHILSAIQAAFHSVGQSTPSWSECAMGAGLSGISNLPRRDRFLVMNPGFARIALESDAYTALLAAHGGRPGAMVASGTGSVGEVLYANGTRKQVLIGFRFALGFCSRSRLGNRFGLRLGDLLLHVFEILKRLKFHKPMLPQAKAL